MSEEGKISLELINRGNRRKNLSFDLKKDGDINKLLECVVGGDNESPMDLYVADLVIDNKSRGAKNIEPIAKAFLHFSTLKNGIEYIEKLKNGLLEGQPEGYPSFLAEVNNKLKKILKQNKIGNDDLNIINGTSIDIFEKLGEVIEKAQNLENKKPDLNKVKEFLLDGSFEKGFKEFRKIQKIKRLNDTRAVKEYLEELKKNENPKFSEKEIKIIENFNLKSVAKDSDFINKYSDLLEEQAKKDLGPQEYGKVYSGEEKDELVGDGYMQTLVSRTNSNQISYSEFVGTEAYKNAISSIFDRAIKGDITLEESAKKVEKELKIENKKNKEFEESIESRVKKNETLNGEEKEYLNKQKEFLEKRNKKIKEYVKNYGLKGEEITEQKANSEEWRRINERFNSAITINQERIEDIEKISKNQTIKKRKTKDRKSKLEKNSEHLQTARRMTIRDMLKMMWKKIKSTANKIFNLSNKILSEGEAIYKTSKIKTSKEEFSIATEKTKGGILNRNKTKQQKKIRDDFNNIGNTKVM